MKKNHYYILGICLLFTVIACGDHRIAMQQMDKAEQIMESSPDSALLILNEINKSTLSKDKESARYALLKSIAIDKNYIDTTTFDVLQPAIDYYIDHGSADERLQTYYYQGRIYQNQGDYNHAMLSFINGKNLYASFTDTLTYARLLVAQGVVALSLYNVDEYIQNNLQASELFDSQGKEKQRISSLARALNGCVLIDNKQKADSIVVVCNNIFKTEAEIPSNLQEVIISYTINFGTAEDTQSIITNLNYEDLSDDNKLDIITGYLKIGKPADALRYLQNLYITDDSGIVTQQKYYLVAIDVYEMNHSYDKALQAFKNYESIFESSTLDKFENDMLFTQKQYEVEVSNLKEKNSKNIIIIISVCCIISLIAITIGIYYRYRVNLSKRLLAENTVTQLENECENLKELLKENDNLDPSIRKSIKERIEMLNTLFAKKITDNESYAKPYLVWIDKLVENKDDFMNSTRLAFKASHPKFIEYLEDHELTVAEINYLCLYAIGLRGKEVGEYIHLKRHYNISSEIRKKLGIDEHETNIGIYIRKLMKNL